MGWSSENSQRDELGDAWGCWVGGFVTEPVTVITALLAPPLPCAGPYIAGGDSVNGIDWTNGSQIGLINL